MRRDIQFSLKQEFDIEKQSHLNTFSYVEEKGGQLEINAVVNTIDYLKEKEIEKIQKKVGNYLKKSVSLYVEQVRVHPGGLREDGAKYSILPSVTPAKMPGEIIKKTREDAISVIKKSAEQIEKIISPSTIEDFSVGFHYKQIPVSIVLKIKRDKPLSEEEVHWLGRILSDAMAQPVDLSVETIPFLPLLVFNREEATLSKEMQAMLIDINKIYSKEGTMGIVVESYPVSRSKKEKRLAMTKYSEM